MKAVNVVFAKFKGAGNESKVITGKGAFSKSGFAEYTNAVLNDTSYETKYLGKDGKEVSFNPSKAVREDHKKSNKNAKSPGPSELAVYDTSELATNGIAEAIPHLVLGYIECGRKFSFPAKKDMCGDIYLANVEGKTRTMPVRDIKTKENRGSVTIVSKNHIQIRAKSPVPKHLQTKTRRDVSGKIIT